MSDWTALDEHTEQHTRPTKLDPLCDYCAETAAEACTPVTIDAALKAATGDRLTVCLAALSLDTPVARMDAIRDARIIFGRWDTLNATDRVLLHRHVGRLVEDVTHVRESV